MKLEGVKVLDLSAFLPGPHMTMMMADHGADVIMVEPANGTGEPTRVLGETTKTVRAFGSETSRVASVA